MILVTTIDLDSFYSNYYFFSRKKRRRSWRIKNKARLKKISCVSLMRKLWCVHERSSSSVANGTKLWTQPWYLWVQPWVFSAACKYRSRREEFASSSLVTRKSGNRGYSYLNEACRDAGAGRDDGLETAVVHHEVANCNKRKKKNKGEIEICNLIVCAG